MRRQAVTVALATLDLIKEVGQFLHGRIGHPTASFAVSPRSLHGSTEAAPASGCCDPSQQTGKTKQALMADKRNLALLSDPQTLRDWGLSDADADYLEKAVPKTRLVSASEAAELWSARRELFFKPVAGHGSKGVYRGSKLTRRVFENILNGGYIAQEFVPAGERNLKIDGTVTMRKVDIRLYTYAGKRLLTAARVYQGQATNFRTPGGGFAPVFQL
jgi:hypothetical protein